MNIIANFVEAIFSFFAENPIALVFLGLYTLVFCVWASGWIKALKDNGKDKK